jgi:hypothetical protein
VKLLQKKRFTEAIRVFERDVNGRWINGLPWAASNADIQAMSSTMHRVSKVLPRSTHGNTLKNLFIKAKGSKTHDYFVLASSIGMASYVA